MEGAASLLVGPVIRKLYVRFRENLPETELSSYATLGAYLLNIEVQPFYWLDDVSEMTDLGPEVGVSGYISDIHAALRRIGRPVPSNIDYPTSLQPFLGRTIQETTLGRVRSMSEAIFVKPMEHKAFTGFVWRGCFDQESRLRVITLSDDTPVYTSTPVNILSEYRAFVLDGEILDVRRYKGDWSKVPCRDTIEGALRVLGAYRRAFCFDWAVLEGGETVLVEMNEGYSFGHYGLKPDLYVRMLSARWEEMSGV